MAQIGQNLHRLVEDQLQTYTKQNYYYFPAYRIINNGAAVTSIVKHSWVPILSVTVDPVSTSNVHVDFNDILCLNDC